MDLLSIVIFFIILLFSVIFHEVAHGLMAERLGDPTARYAGRLTLNPIPHIDPIGSILLPLMMWFATNGQFVLGSAKPVPVDYRNFKNVRLGMILVAIVGPLTNFLLACIAAAVLRFTPHISSKGIELLSQFVLLNLVLTIFNLLPVPPLDGSKILAGLLGDLGRDCVHWFLGMVRRWFILVILLLVTRVLKQVLFPPVEYLFRLLLAG